jgi:hypothetical protein
MKLGWRNSVRVARGTPGNSWRNILAAGVLVLCCATVARAAEEGLSEANTEHFVGLRQRGLHRLAEAEIEHRLTWPRLTTGEQTALVLALAETLLSHARQLGESQRVSLWERTREVIRGQLGNETTPPRVSLLELQLVLVDREEAEACRRLVTIAAWNQQARQRGLQAATEGLNRLRNLSPPTARTARGGAKSTSKGMTATQRGRLQILQGELLSCEAELLPERSTDRAARLVAARQLLQPLVEQRTEVEQAELARVLLARVLRLEGETREARTVIEAARRQSRDSQIQAALSREETECRLAEGDLAEARSLIEQLSGETEPRSDERFDSWDNRLLAARVWIACWRSGMKANSRLATRDLKAAQEILAQGVAAASGQWRDLFVWLDDALREEISLGPELAAVSLEIRQALADGDDQRADRLLARGAEFALRRGLRDRAADWGVQRGSLALERQAWEAAAQDLLAVAREFPSHPKAPEAQLLGAYALGRQWRAEMSEELRNQYRAALEEFCSRFPEDSGRAEAEWMLGELLRWEGQLGEAANHFDRIPRGHPRSAGAVRALADLTLQQIRAGKLEPTEQDLLRERLAGRVPPPEETLGTDERPVALALAELELVSPRPDWTTIDELLRRVEQSLSIRETSAIERPEEAENQQSLSTGADSATVWRLRVLSAAAQSRWAEMDRLIENPAPLKVPQMLDLLEQLASRAQLPTDSGRETGSSGLPLTKLAGLLERRHTDLLPEEKLRLELILARWAVLKGQPTEARARFERAVALSPGDGPAPLEYAWFLIGCPDVESKQAGVALLVRRERQWKAGTEAWLNARIEVLKGLRSAGRTEEACRLLKTTRILFPKTGTPAQSGVLGELQKFCN